MGLNSEILSNFDGKEIDIKTYSPLTLAYIGDDVFDLIIRTIVVNKGNTTPNKLHKKATKYVKASSQAMMLSAIETYLTDEEKNIARRGRNSKPHTKAKNASVADYMAATALETLIGFLYLSDDMDRIYYLMKIGIKALG